MTSVFELPGEVGIRDFLSMHIKNVFRIIHLEYFTKWLLGLAREYQTESSNEVGIWTAL